MVRCASTSLFGKKDLRDKWQCLSMCLDYTGCMGAAFYKPNDECSLHDCHEMISFNSFWLSYKRICKGAHFTFLFSSMEIIKELLELQTLILD